MTGLIVFGIIVLIIIIVFSAYYEGPDNIDLINEKEKKINESLGKIEFNQDIKYDYKNTNDRIYALFAIDSSKEMIAATESGDNIDPIPFSKITGCEILEDSAVTGGIGRAVAGGILAGGVGAIVGATTKKKEISSYKIIIYMSDINRPKIVLNLITSKMKIDSLYYKDAVRFANDVNASVKSIISKNNENLNHSKVQVGCKEKLIDLKELKDSGLISSDEYEQKRSKIIESI